MKAKVKQLTLHNLFRFGVDVEVSPQRFLEDGFTEPKFGGVDLGEGILQERVWLRQAVKTFS